MKNKIILTVALTLLLFSGLAWALDNSASFLLPNPNPTPTQRTIMVIVQVSVPEDMQLLRKDGSVVKDEVCVGEDFRFLDQTDDGDYWQEGGYIGDPPIHWTTDVKTVALSMNNAGMRDTKEYRELVATQTYPLNLGTGGVCLQGLNLTLGNNPLPAGNIRNIQGGLACTLKPKVPVVSGAQKMGEFYSPESRGLIDFKAETDVECFYYFTTEDDQLTGVAAPTAVGVCGENSPIQPIADDGTLNASNINDLQNQEFKVGTIKFNKKIRVVEPGKQSVEITVIGADNLKIGQENMLKVLVKNNGQLAVKIKDVESASAKYRFIACAAQDLAPGEETECIITVTPGPGEGSDILLNYEYKACGKLDSAVAYEGGENVRNVAPSKSTQAYRIDVHGACENTYYGCSTPDKEGKFYAGGKCYNTDDQYFSPAGERFVLGFYLPSELAGKTVTSAKLKTFVAGVQKAQEISVYSGTNPWAEASCVAGGDICKKPGCEICAPLFGPAGEHVTSQTVQSQSSVSFDVTEAVKKAYAGGKATLSLELRGSEENRWASDGKNACTIKGNWETYDVAFYGKGPNQPYLEIAYD